jgi:hypothetical protein
LAGAGQRHLSGYAVSPSPRPPMLTKTGGTINLRRR